MSGVNAQLKRHNQAPRKMRLLTSLIKGKSVDQAIAILSFNSKRGSNAMVKLLASAVANAKNNFKLDARELYVKNASVNPGVVMKRGRARAFGRSYPIRRKTSDIHIVLDVKK